MLDDFDCYVINLPERVDRLRDFRLPAKVFPAIRPTSPNGFESIGARGCFLSHLSVLKLARDRPLMIFEDDCDLVKGARWEPLGDWGIFYGGHRLEHPETPLAPDVPVVTAHMVGFHPDIIQRLITYLEAMLRRAPGDARGGPMHIDGAYSWFRRENPDVITKLAIPPIAFQRPSRSSIHPPRWVEKVPMVDTMRRIKRAASMIRRSGPHTE
jgi:hypothetical protein